MKLKFGKHINYRELGIRIYNDKKMDKINENNNLKIRKFFIKLNLWKYFLTMSFGTKIKIKNCEFDKECVANNMGTKISLSDFTK